LELKQLRYFVAVAEEGHFGRAAERLHRSQPPVSMQIIKLEEELGVQLFERTTRHVMLTDAGEVFLGKARAILSSLEQAKASVGSASQGLQGNLKLGFVSSAALSLLPLVLKRYKESYPEVNLTLREQTTAEQYEALAKGQIRVGIIRSSTPSTDVDVFPVVSEGYLVALPEKHDLAKKESLTISDLGDEAIIGSPRALMPSFVDGLVEMFAEAGLEPNFSQEAIHLQTMVSLVAAEMGVAILPACTMNAQRTGVVYRPLITPMKTELSVAVKRGDSSPLLDNFLKVVKEISEYDNE